MKQVFGAVLTVMIGLTGMAGAAPLATVSFELYNNRVYLPVLVNGKRIYSLILDSGAAASGLSDSVAEELGLELKGKGSVEGNGERTLPIRIAKNVSFRVGGAELSEKTVGVLPMGEIEQHEGRRIAGLLGVNFFRRYCVVLNYGEKTVTIYEPAALAYSGTGRVLPLHFKGNAALFPASVMMPGGKSVEAEIAIDSGTYSALRLYAPFIKEHQLLASHPPLQPSFGFGLGGEFREQLGRVESLTLAGLPVAMPVTSFSQASGGVTAVRSYDGTIGGDFLKRFTAVFDYPHAQLILSPNARFKEPFDADGSGLTLEAAGDSLEEIRILHVNEKTPGSTTGLQVGDVIEALDGKRTTGLGLDEIRTLLCKMGAYKLMVRRDGRLLEIPLITRVLI